MKSALSTTNSGTDSPDISPEERASTAETGFGASEPGTDDFPFPGGLLRFQQKLGALHSRLRGELLKHEDGKTPLVALQEARELMAQIEGLATFVRAPTDVLARPAIRTRKRTRARLPKSVPEYILIKLRRSQAWCTAVQVLDFIVEENALELTAQQRRELLQRVRVAAHSMKTSGFVKPLFDVKFGTGQRVEQRWTLGTRYTGPHVPVHARFIEPPRPNDAPSPEPAAATSPGSEKQAA